MKSGKGRWPQRDFTSEIRKNAENEKTKKPQKTVPFGFFISLVFPVFSNFVLRISCFIVLYLYRLRTMFLRFREHRLSGIRPANQPRRVQQCPLEQKLQGRQLGLPAR